MTFCNFEKAKLKKKSGISRGKAISEGGCRSSNWQKRRELGQEKRGQRNDASKKKPLDVDNDFERRKE